MNSGAYSKVIAPVSVVSLKNVTVYEEQDCELSPINVSTAQEDFTALQYALFIALFIQVKKYYDILLCKDVMTIVNER